MTGTRDGYLYAWHTKGTDSGVVQWESYHHDNANTGNFGQKLDQGVLRSNQGVLNCALDCSASTASAPATSYSAGGAGCEVVSRPSERQGWAGALWLGVGLGLGGLLVRRRRR